MTIIVLLIPGSIPTILVFISKYTLSLFDKEDIVLNYVTGMYFDFLAFFPYAIQDFVIPFLVLISILVYLIGLKLQHPEESISLTINRKVNGTYKKYIKYPNSR